MTYNECLDYLYNSLPVFQHIGGDAYKAGLDNILALEKVLEDPHKKFRSVHIAGTNGKGSVSHMMASTLTAAGYRTALFTSPHLIDFRERIKINGEMIPQEVVVEFVEQYKADIERIQPSFFEITSAIAFDYFATQKVDIAIIEVGMGGRLDSTNIIHPLLSVITNIGLDHTQFLGDTLEKIAGEKAGIIKESTPVVVGESHIETKLTFISQAKQKLSPIIFADQMYRVVKQSVNNPRTETADDSSSQIFEIESLLDGAQFSLECDLNGDYQRKNIVTTLAALDVLNGNGGISISQDSVRRGIASAATSTRLQGRWQTLCASPLTICDTGHNEAGLTEVIAQVERQKYDQLYMILGFVSDKDLTKVLTLLPKKAHYIFTQAAIPRALDSKILAEKAALFGLSGECANSVKEAIVIGQKNASAQDMIFIGGSTFIVGEALEVFVAQETSK